MQSFSSSQLQAPGKFQEIISRGPCSLTWYFAELLVCYFKFLIKYTWQISFIKKQGYLLQGERSHLLSVLSSQAPRSVKAYMKYVCCFEGSQRQIWMWFLTLDKWQHFVDLAFLSSLWKHCASLYSCPKKQKKLHLAIFLQPNCFQVSRVCNHWKVGFQSGPANELEITSKNIKMCQCCIKEWKQSTSSWINW